ncbi:MAG: TolC family protein [Polyangiales bacterium]
MKRSSANGDHLNDEDKMSMHSLTNSVRPSKLENAPSDASCGTFESKRSLSLATFVSKYSRIIAALAWVVPVSASAQTRTPTSPLDTTPGSAETTPAPTVETPPATPAPTVAAPAPLPRLTVAGRTEVSLDDLLPAETFDADGIDVERAVARPRRSRSRAGRGGVGGRGGRRGVAAARRGFVPQARVSARYTRLSDITPGTIPTFDTAACLGDLVGCQSDPGAFTRDVVLQEPILNQYAIRASFSSRLSDLVFAQPQQLRAARAEAEAAAERARATRDQLEVDVVAAYWEVVRARAQLVLARETASVAEARAREAAARSNQGVGTEAERLAADAGSRGYEPLLRVAESRVEIAEALLRDLLRLEPNAPLPLRANLGALPEAPNLAPEQLRRSARKRSPDVAAALASAEAADARADAARAGLYPALGVSFNVDVANPNQRIFPQTTDFTTTWDASVELSWSFDGALVAGARVDQQRAAAEEQRLAAEEMRENIERGALRARGELLSSLAGVDARHAAAAAANERARVTSERARAGLATNTDLADAESARLGARLDLVDAVVDAHLAEARLRRALGTDPLDVARVEER